LFKIVEQFEKAVAKYADAPYAVAVDSCSSAIMLSTAFVLQDVEWHKGRRFYIPKLTYCSVPNAILNAGGWVEFDDRSWQGVYQIRPHAISDGALRFSSGMYIGGLHCLSFQYKKHIPIGKGGMILCPSKRIRDWLRCARWNGRSLDHITEDNPYGLIQRGWNCYMLPEHAARGLYHLQYIGKFNADREEIYDDLSKLDLYDN
jgi:dTDP-4-amino-4,6-dideoxygalactose transaminase